VTFALHVCGEGGRRDRSATHSHLSSANPVTLEFFDLMDFVFDILDLEVNGGRVACG